VTVVKAHFDGKVLVPDGPVDLPINCPLELAVTAVESRGPEPLVQPLRALEDLPENPNWPADGASQHDHYLYHSLQGSIRAGPKASRKEGFKK
jgi:hypothetical protein